MKLGSVSLHLTLRLPSEVQLELLHLNSGEECHRDLGVISGAHIRTNETLCTNNFSPTKIGARIITVLDTYLMY